MGGGASAHKTTVTSAAERSEFASYRQDYHKARSEGLPNHEIFEKMSKDNAGILSVHDEASAAPRTKSPGRSKYRTGSQQYIPPKGPGASVDSLRATHRRNSALGVVSHDTKRHRRNQIFEDGFDFTLAAAREGMAKLEGGFDKTKEVFQDGNDKLILEALVSFFFIGEDGSDQMKALIDTMEKETRPAGDWLMREGDPGDAMYVIKTGKLEVWVKGKLTRHVGRGGAVGELALLYHTPRSASVKVVEDAVMFSLHRAKFREMLALSVSASLVQRVAWMQDIPEFELLDNQAASRLAGAFSTLHLRQGETVAAEGDTVDQCFLIEYGSVEITSSITASPEALKRQLNPALPRSCTLRQLALPPVAASAPGGSSGETAGGDPKPMAALTECLTDGSQNGSGGRASDECASDTVVKDARGVDEQRAEGETDKDCPIPSIALSEPTCAAGDQEMELPGTVDKDDIDGDALGLAIDEEGADVVEESTLPRTLVYGPGTFLGMPVLLCAGKGRKGGCWPMANRPAATEGEANAERAGGTETASAAVKRASQTEWFPGAVCPVTIVAKEDLRISYFTPAQFESIVGPIREVFSQQLKGRPSLLRKVNSQSFIEEQDTRFTADDFETEMFLGTGSFGRVTLVTFKDRKKQQDAGLGEVQRFALKALSKKAVIERGQLAHVRDEKLLLQNMNHPLILELFSTFQDANSLYFLLEAVTAGEMWSVVYEGASGFAEGELPIQHGRFYAACVLEALAYMHARGVAYRDLKPENIMVDKEGYPRLIDLGFAKKIPFTLVVDGKPEVHPKSFTMCGTPEYLAPEFIFNTGHDKSADCWALGVLTFEFTAGFTPFQQPGEPSDMTALFTRIASSKVATSNTLFPADYDQKAGNAHSRDIVIKLLQSDPSQRLGNLAGGMDDARIHPYFAEIDWMALAHKRMPAPWKPPKPIATPSNDEGYHKDVPIFTGDDAVFKHW